MLLEVWEEVGVMVAEEKIEGKEEEVGEEEDGKTVTVLELWTLDVVSTGWIVEEDTLLLLSVTATAVDVRGAANGELKVEDDSEKVLVLWTIDVVNTGCAVEENTLLLLSVAATAVEVRGAANGELKEEDDSEKVLVLWIIDVVNTG